MNQVNTFITGTITQEPSDEVAELLLSALEDVYDTGVQGITTPGPQGITTPGPQGPPGIQGPRGEKGSEKVQLIIDQIRALMESGEISDIDNMAEPILFKLMEDK